MERRVNRNNFDNLSNLPESIFHKILSLLDIKYVARIATLSSRCRNLCLSSPYLSIHYRGRDPYDDDEFYRFCEFVERFMSLRNGVGIHQFEVLLKCEIDVGFRVGTWILQATRSNVERICLELDEVRSFTLPIGVWNIASLRELELNLHTGKLTLPSTSVSRIEILTLKRLRVSVELLSKFILSCEWLKKLHLDEVSGFGELNISSSSLEHLQIDNLCFHSLKLKVSADRLKYLSILYKSDRVNHSLRLHAPRLERFYWSGKVFNYSYEGDFGSLKHADISIIPSPVLGDKTACKRIMVSVLETVYSVSSLRVSDLAIKVSLFVTNFFFQLCEFIFFFHLNGL